MSLYQDINNTENTNVNLQRHEKFNYFKMCDKFRTYYENGEGLWQDMMKNKEECSIFDYEDQLNCKEMLEEDETLEEFDDYNLQSDSSSAFYKSEMNDIPCFFYQTAGFEYIFLQEHNYPKKIPENKLKNII